MKAIIFCLALLGATQASACDYLTGGCILQQYGKADIVTQQDNADDWGWLRGFLWND